MFTSISRLSRVFAKNTPIITATPQILTKTQTPKQEEKPEEINKLSKQKNLTTLVENEIGWFRSPHLVYEKTIGRQQQQVLEHHQNKFDDITKQGFAMRLISLYGKPGMFDELPERTTVKTYNALLNASVVSNKFDETQKLFRELSLKKLSDFPSAFIEMGKWENAHSMLDGVEPSLITFKTLLNGFYRDVELVEQLGNNVEKPNLFTYNVLIKWYGNNGNLDEAKSVYDNMLKSDIVPDWFTFEALIPCVCEKGEFGLALKLCEKSIGSNCHVSAGMVQVVVDGLVKESKVEEAKVEKVLSFEIENASRN
ncbi:hypothetical protein IFM89_025701 [Coptis chinensis]|uniref:Pentatricopeptide repeat-containing protein n=1 Tax=Coptis chinensis TaxID=261450 RepID=A0A835GZU4_9MAGN|nr:hypothetical protein IFM89_025701 [Coptis chinensis]